MKCLKYWWKKFKKIYIDCAHVLKNIVKLSILSRVIFNYLLKVQEYFSHRLFPTTNPVLHDL